MKHEIVRLLRDRRGSSFEGIALSVAIIAVAFVASADMIDYTLKKHADSVQIASAKPAALQVAGNTASPTNTAGALDTTPTGSLPVLISRSVLDPCTGRTH